MCGHHHHRFSHWRGPRHSLQRRLFVWFGVTIALTALVVGAVFATFGPSGTRWMQEAEVARDLVSEQFASVWQHPTERHALVERLGRAFDAAITLEGPDGVIIDEIGGPCFRARYEVTVRSAGVVLGTVRGCPKHHPHAPWVLLVALAAAGTTLWFASAAISMRLARPLSELARVTRDIGAGRLSARVRLGRHQPGEVGALADAVNDMAARIEEQLRGERELLAAVSHEIRSPLSRLRVLAELLRTSADHEHTLAEIEREIVAIDELVGKLLASSRLDFKALSPKSIVARDAAARALELAGMSPALMQDESGGATLEADPNLLGSALANLLENAKTHGGGVDAIIVREESTAGAPRLVFEVTDRGAGFADSDLPRVFEPFFRSGDRGHGSLGLGLSLVDRIARAHGGSVFARNRSEGGAAVGIRLPLLHVEAGGFSSR